MLRDHRQLILIVDDEKIVRDIGTAVLERAGFEVLTAADGVEGFQRAAEHRGDLALLLTDLMMPQMDGLDLAREVRKICGKVPIILMSSYTDLLDKAKGSGWPFLQKPFGIDGLLRSVRAALGEASERTLRAV